MNKRPNKLCGSVDLSACLTDLTALLCRPVRSENEPVIVEMEVKAGESALAFAAA